MPSQLVKISILSGPCKIDRPKLRTSLDDIQIRIRPVPDKRSFERAGNDLVEDDCAFKRPAI
jgi:hypothetical protein